MSSHKEKPDRSRDKTLSFETRAIHAGVMPDPTTGAVNPPIYQTAAYAFESTEQAAGLFDLSRAGFIYSRITNPTVAALEKRLASLEGGVGATCAASGHAAQMLIFFSLLSPNDEYIASKKLYGGSISQIKSSFPRGFGWNGHMVDPDDLDAMKRAINEKTKFIFVESLANPAGAISDIEAMARIAEQAHIPLIVDNTMASPYLCRPLEYGASVVTHSTTKFLCGNATSMGGAVIDGGTFDWAKDNKFPALTSEPAYNGMNFCEKFKDKALTAHLHAVGLKDLGPCQQPMNAWLTLLGIETLPLRMQKHCDNALAVAKFLQSHKAVSWVNYAGLENSPYYKLHKKYLPDGAGSVFTFGLKSGAKGCTQVIERARIFTHLANIGDTRSLMIHPYSTTHSPLDEAHKVAAHAGPDLIRLSIGLEKADDLIADLEYAMQGL